jgi:hypothetical protein
MRACWATAPQPADPAERQLVAVGPGRLAGREAIPGSASGRQPRTFVPVEPVSPAASTMLSATGEAGQGGVTTDIAVTNAAAISPATGAPGRIPGTWWLWGDPEPWPDL